MRHMEMHLVLCFTEVYLNSIRIFYAIRQRIPFIQPQMLFEFCLFHGNLDRIFGKVFHQFVNSLPGHVIYKENTIAAGI